MPHILFVWTLRDILGLIFWGCVAIVFAMIGVIMLYEKAKRWFKTAFASFLRGTK